MKIGRGDRSAPADKGCEVLDGELTHEYRDKMTVKILLIAMISTFC